MLKCPNCFKKNAYISIKLAYKTCWIGLLSKATVTLFHLYIYLKKIKTNSINIEHKNIPSKYLEKYFRVIGFLMINFT